MSGQQEAWPNIKEVANLYGAEKVGLTVHMFPLPYHQNAFYASRAAFVIHYLTNGTKTFQWIERILLEKLPDLTDSAFYNKSDVDLLNLFEEYVSDMGVDVATFRDMVDRRNSNQFERYTRIMWKYACSRGVAGTPTYIVNGIVQPNIEQSWGLNEWKLFINPLLQPQLFDDIDYLEINQPEEVTQPSCSGNNRGSITPANKNFI